MNLSRRAFATTILGALVAAALPLPRLRVRPSAPPEPPEPPAPLPPPRQAQDATFTGAVSADWDDPRNWKDRVMPTDSGARIVIDAPGRVCRVPPRTISCERMELRSSNTTLIGACLGASVIRGERSDAPALVARGSFGLITGLTIAAAGTGAHLASPVHRVPPPASSVTTRRWDSRRYHHAHG